MVPQLCGTCKASAEKDGISGGLRGGGGCWLRGRGLWCKALIMLLNHFFDLGDAAFGVGLTALTAIAASLHRFLDLDRAALIGEEFFKLFSADPTAIAQNRHDSDSPSLECETCRQHNADANHSQ